MQQFTLDGYLPVLSRFSAACLSAASPSACGFVRKVTVYTNMSGTWRSPCVCLFCLGILLLCGVPNRGYSSHKVRCETQVGCRGRYHGWRFDGKGACTAIPQAIDAKAEANARASPRACATSYPTKVSGNPEDRSCLAYAVFQVAYSNPTAVGVATSASLNCLFSRRPVIISMCISTAF